MNLKKLLTSLAAVCVLASAHASAQIPGDGLPDFYHFCTNNATVETSLGPVTRPMDTLLVDTDGTDLIAILIGGIGQADLAAVPANGDYLATTPNLPDPNAPPFFASSWTTGSINNSGQFVRTAPLDTLGFVGVIGEYDDPFDIFPNLGLGRFSPDVYERVFENEGVLWHILTATNDSGSFFTDITPVNPSPSGIGICNVPEPSSMFALLASIGMCVSLRRR